MLPPEAVYPTPSPFAYRPHRLEGTVLSVRHVARRRWGKYGWQSGGRRQYSRLVSHTNPGGVMDFKTRQRLPGSVIQREPILSWGGGADR